MAYKSKHSDAEIETILDLGQSILVDREPPHWPKVYLKDDNDGESTGEVGNEDHATNLIAHNSDDTGDYRALQVLDSDEAEEVSDALRLKLRIDDEITYYKILTEANAAEFIEENIVNEVSEIIMSNITPYKIGARPLRQSGGYGTSTTNLNGMWWKIGTVACTGTYYTYGFRMLIMFNSKQGVIELNVMFRVDSTSGVLDSSSYIWVDTLSTGVGVGSTSNQITAENFAIDNSTEGEAVLYMQMPNKTYCSFNAVIVAEWYNVNAPSANSAKFQFADAYYGSAAVEGTHYESSITQTVVGQQLVLPIANGGTGAATAADARTNLGITPANIGAAPSDEHHLITYTSVTQLGLTAGEATLNEAYNALPEISQLVTIAGDFASSEVPSSMGYVIVEKAASQARSGAFFRGKTRTDGDYRMHMNGSGNQFFGTWYQTYTSYDLATTIQTLLQGGKISVVKSVQRGTVDAGTSASGTITITSVEPTKAFTNLAGIVDGQGSTVQLKLDSATSLTWSRSAIYGQSSATKSGFSWEVIEYY